MFSPPYKRPRGISHVTWAGATRRQVAVAAEHRLGGYEISLAVVPLDSDFQPLKEVRPFYTNVAPNHPERQEPTSAHVHGLDINDLLIHRPAKSGQPTCWSNGLGGWSYHGPRA